MMVDQIFQVARTYAYRPRFWVFGGCYAVSMFWWTAHSINPEVQACTSAAYASTVGCFVALHLRRQFGSSLAKMMPGFATAHLIVGLAASLTIWIFIPLIGSWASGLPYLSNIGLHAIAGLLLALVAMWRKAILLLACVPMAILWSRLPLHQGSWGTQFIEGRLPWVAAGFIASALLAHLVAAFVLLRLSDQNAAASDDFLVETPRSDHIVGRWDEWILTWRDATVRHRLADAGYGWWAVHRWRIPTIACREQLGLAVLLALALLAIAWTASKDRGTAGAISVLVATPAMLIAPFGYWHQRRMALSLESMRPVTRVQYLREIALALALDVCRWTTVASVYSTVIFYLSVTNPSLGLDMRDFLMGQFVILWGLAALLYGLGLATFRLRYWIPMMIGFGILWMLLVMPSLFVHPHGVRASLIHDGLRFAIISSATGAVLAGLAYSFWLQTDMT